MSFFKPIFQISKNTLKSLMWFVWIVRFLLFSGFLYVVISVGFYLFHPSGLPKTDAAPFAIATSMTDNQTFRLYYAKDVVNLNGEYIMTDWWSYNGKKYVLTPGPKPLNGWDSVRVYRR